MKVISIQSIQAGLLQSSQIYYFWAGAVSVFPAQAGSRSHQSSSTPHRSPNLNLHHLILVAPRLAVLSNHSIACNRGNSSPYMMSTHGVEEHDEIRRNLYHQSKACFTKQVVICNKFHPLSSSLSAIDLIEL